MKHHVIPHIYLAGGFYADNWQDKVEKGIQQKISFDKDTPVSCTGHSVKFHNPKSKERGTEPSEAQQAAFKNPKAYTLWDLTAIDDSDLVFAYIDQGNPAVGVIAEIGYAVGKGIGVVLVIDENHERIKDRYFDFLRNMPNVVSFYSLDEGIAYTNAILELF